ncbi:MAG TPA: DNA repair protein RadC [Flavobacteriales bacterium]|nr:DNA repair protein RadC [Flavobacteriales bacterium]
MDEGRLSIRDWAKDDRPREKLLAQGARALSDAELIAILIRSGTAKESALDLAKRIMAQVGNDLHRLGVMGPKELTRFNGMGEAKALSIVAALELGRRRRGMEPVPEPSVTASSTAYELVRAKLSDLRHEEFWVILLDRANRLIEVLAVSKGGLHQTVADPKVIFKMALDRSASGLILCHNHPSGQLRPSAEDIALTKKLVDGARLLDLSVHDHIIVGAGGYFSFADNMMIPS